MVVFGCLFHCFACFKDTLFGHKDFIFLTPSQAEYCKYPTQLMSTACLPTNGWQPSILPLQGSLLVAVACTHSPLLLLIQLSTLKAVHTHSSPQSSSAPEGRT